MSHRLVAWALKQKLGSPHKKSVFVALCSFAGDDGKNCFPGQGLLCEITELSEDTVQRTLKALDVDHRIVRTKSRKRGQWASWVYEIILADDVHQTAPSGTVSDASQAAAGGMDQAAISGTAGKRQAAPSGLTKPLPAVRPSRSQRPYPVIEPITDPSHARESSSAVALGSLGEAVLKRIGPDNFKAWLSKAEFVGDVVDDIVTIALPTPYYRNHVDREFGHALLECCRKIRPATKRVNIIVAEAA